MKAMKKLTAIDLFCGCGGLTTGLKKAGFDVLAAVDLNPLAVETYQMNHKSTHVWETDISELSVVELKRTLGIKSGELDLLAGCPPCEGFSSLRTLNGAKHISDSRNDLVFQFLRFVKGLKPKTIMLENVPRLKIDRRMSRVTRELTKLGYTFVLDVLDAADYGVPQRRKRMILLGTKKGDIDFAPEARKLRTVYDAIGSLPRAGTTDDILHADFSNRSARIRRLIKKIPKDGGGRSDLGPAAQLPCHKRCNGFKDIYGRMAWRQVAPTITGGCINPSKGRFLHPREDRAITLREAALLQTFPPNYKFSLRQGSYAAASMIGDALPPEFIRRHAKRLAEHLRKLQ